MGHLPIHRPIFRRTDNGKYRRYDVRDNIWTDDGVLTTICDGQETLTFDADTLARRVRSDDNTLWVRPLYTGDDPTYADDWIPHPQQVEAEPAAYSAPTSPTDLSFVKVAGEGSRALINSFLEDTEGLVHHELGSISSWKAAFAARYDGELVSVITVHQYNPHTPEEISITRLASREIAPKNTSTWMIARARDWVERAGYARLTTFAGVDGNAGVCYRAAGMHPDGDPVEVEGKTWTAAADRTWMKQRFVDELEPEPYADKDEEWATQTVCDGVIVPGTDDTDDSITVEQTGETVPVI